MPDHQSRRIYVMRHAKSDWSAELRDFERPLASRGVADARAMAKWLAKAIAPAFTLIYSSARRTSETADILAAVIKPESVVADERLYLAHLSVLLEIVNSVGGDLMLVGHNPGLEEFVRYLDHDVESRVQKNKLLPTSAVYAYTVAGPVKAGSGHFEFHQRPKLLRVAE